MSYWLLRANTPTPNSLTHSLWHRAFYVVLFFFFFFNITIFYSLKQEDIKR